MKILRVIAFVCFGLLGVSPAFATGFCPATGCALTSSQILSAGGALSSSPQFTGNPTAPTQSTGDTSTSISTDAFVVATLLAGLQSALTNTSLTGVPTAPTASSSTSTMQLATTAFVQNLFASVSSGANAAFTPTGGATPLKPADIQGRNFDPRSYGAPFGNNAVLIGSVYPNATVESLAATTVNGATPYSELTDERSGLKFQMILTSLPSATTPVFTTTVGGGNNPSVAGVPQYCQDVAHLNRCVLPGMTLTDLGPAVNGNPPAPTASAKSGTNVCTVSSTIPWPIFGITQPSGTPGTITCSAATSGWAASDYILAEWTPTMVQNNLTMGWLGVRAAVYAADQQTGGGKVQMGPGTYHFGSGSIYQFGDNPVTIIGGERNYAAYDSSDQVQEDARLPVGASIFADYKIDVNTRFATNYVDMNIEGQDPGAQPYGTSTQTENAIYLGQDSSVHTAWVSDVYAGVALGADHHNVDDLRDGLAFYGILRANFSNSNGNDYVTNPGLSGSEAAIGIGYNATMDATHFTYGELANSPHVVYKETTFFNSLIPSGALLNGCLTNGVIDDVQAESLGGTPIECNGGNISTEVWRTWRPGLLTSNGSPVIDISGETAACLFHSTASIDHNVFTNSDPQPSGAGGWFTSAVLCGSSVQENSLGDWGLEMTTYPTKAIVLASNASAVGGNTMDNTILTSPTGQTPGFQHLESGQNYSGGTLSAGTLVTAGANGFNYAQVATNSTCLSEPMGVIVQGGANNAAVFFATRGDALVNHYTTDVSAISPGSPLAVSCNSASSGAYGLPNATAYVNGYGVSLGTSLMPTTTTATTLYVALAFSSGDPLRTDFNGGFNLGALTVSNLPTSCNAGAALYATNGRNPGEASGAGTGVPVFCHSGNSWWPYGGSAVVASSVRHTVSVPARSITVTPKIRPTWFERLFGAPKIEPIVVTLPAETISMPQVGLPVLPGRVRD